MIYGNHLYRLKKGKGPNIDPCGTPVVIFNLSEKLSPNCTYCSLFVR